MKTLSKYMIALVLLPTTLYAWSWHWADLWQTADQQGEKLLQSGHAEAASQKFANQEWRAVADYRSGHYTQAFQQFGAKKTSDSQYNAGNAAAYLGHYQEAITAYDKAIALNANNTDAITNREIIKKLLTQKQQSQNNSTANDKNNKNANSSQSAGQDNASNQQGSDKNNNPKSDAKEKTGSPSQASHASQKQIDDQKSDAKQTAANSTADRFTAQDENKKQLLRRIADDPGGLLRQKFLRDYYRRHGAAENPDQGVS